MKRRTPNECRMTIKLTMTIKRRTTNKCRMTDDLQVTDQTPGPPGRAQEVTHLGK